MKRDTPLKRAVTGISIGLGISALLIGLSACGAAYDEAPAAPKDAEEVAAENGEALWEATYTLSDGRTITCIGYSGIKKGGLSCDFAGASRE